MSVFSGDKELWNYALKDQREHTMNIIKFKILHSYSSYNGVIAVGFI